MRNSRIYTYILASLCWALGAVVILSWILGALFPESGIRTMLSGEAIRWLCSHFVEFCKSPALVWLLLMAMSAGVVRGSGILELPRIHHAKRRMAVVCMALVTVLFLAITALLTLVPHAVLLSAVGSLWHSPFSAILVPLVAFYVFAVSATFGMAVGRFCSFAQIAAALSQGISLAAPIFVLFIAASVFVNIVKYVFFA